MLHFGFIDIRTDIFVFVLVFILVLFQLLLCFKAKKNIIRLIPVCLFSGLAVLFIVLGFIFSDWDSFGFFFLAGCTLVLLLACGIGWGIWVVIRKNADLMLYKGYKK